MHSASQRRPSCLLCSIAETLTRLPSPEANIPAGLLFVIAADLSTSESKRAGSRAKRSAVVSSAILWALLVFAMTVIVLAGTILLFSGA